jgi:hypothetical protein
VFVFVLVFVGLQPSVKLKRNHLGLPTTRVV